MVLWVWDGGCVAGGWGGGGGERFIRATSKIHMLQRCVAESSITSAECVLEVLGDK